METQDLHNKTGNGGTWYRSGGKADERDRGNTKENKGERERKQERCDRLGKHG